MRDKINLLIFLASLLLCCSFLLPESQKKSTLFLIGDSTVRNGTYGRGDGGLWGWGSFIHLFLDTNRLQVQNRAMGGTSSRSYFEIGLWDKVLEDIKPGDFVLMQFGHNDNGKYSIKNNSEDTLHYTDPKTGREVVVHSYGWNIRKYISETKAKGAIPVVLSLVPRNIWKDGKVNRSTNDFTLWARQAANQENALFVDLNTIIADRYDRDTEAKVKSTYFGTDHVHTIEAGAKVNAACVIKGLLQLKGKPFKKYINKKIWKEY
jgi:lysophospholipase L1-like esterase